MNYELYHDESMEGGFWHGMLLVPSIHKEELVSFLGEVRENVDYSDPLGIKKVKEYGRIYDCADAWIQVGVASLRARAKGWPYPIFLGNRQKGRRVYTFFSPNCIGVKFILFCERDNHKQMAFYPDHASKIETTFRMGLKGGIHYLGSEEEPINIEKMHFDGHEHLRRHIDKTRIVGRLHDLRNYCSIASSSDDLIDDRCSDHRKTDSQEPGDCQLLQLTDLLIGCSRTLLGQGTRDIHHQLARPIRAIMQRYREGYARMKNSRWRNSFWMSRCFLYSGHWSFETIEYGNNPKLQISFPFSTT